MEKSQIILFDGVCNLCNGSVNFIIDLDSKKRFKFGALQEEKAKELLTKFGLNPTKLDSVTLIINDKVYRKSSAALEICRQLDGGWKILYIFKIIPRFLRDMVYDIIARNRYNWFGRKDECKIPTPDLKARFI